MVLNSRYIYTNDYSYIIICNMIVKLTYSANNTSLIINILGIRGIYSANKTAMRNMVYKSCISLMQYQYWLV